MEGSWRVVFGLIGLGLLFLWCYCKFYWKRSIQQRQVAIVVVERAPQIPAANTTTLELRPTVVTIPQDLPPPYESVVSAPPPGFKHSTSTESSCPDYNHAMASRVT